MRQSYSEEDQQKLRPLMDHYSRGLINADPPDHTRLRRLVQAAFLPRTLEKLTPRVEAIVAGLLDRIASRGKTEWIADLAYPLPVTVIAELLAVPADMHGRFKAWSQGIVAFMASPRPDVDVALGSQKALVELRDYFRTIFDQRRRQPGDDLVSNLVNVHLEGDALSEEELLSTCVTILIGSANRDPEAFDDPDTFSLHRATNRHVSFGYGVHFCLGAALARLEAPIALRGLLERFDSVRLDGDVDWHDGMVRCLRTVPLAFTAGE